MIFNHKNLQVFVYRNPVDMIKDHDGLSSILENQMGQELLSGAVFLFVNNNWRLCKALYFDGAGAVIVHKRLESGRFMSFLGFEENQKISISELALIFEGDTLRIHKKAKQFHYGNKRPKPTNRRVRLKTNHEYLNRVIVVLNGSVKMLIDENKRLKEALGDNKQNALIELQDQVEMLNLRFFDKGSESLKKSRPPKNYDRELLPHKVPPVEITEEVLPKINEVEINYVDVNCPCCNDPKLEEMKGQFEESAEIDLVEKTAIKKKHKRQKYRCKNCESIVTANGSAKVKKAANTQSTFVSQLLLINLAIIYD